MGVFYQVLSTVILCYLCLTMGIMYTWPSSTLVIFSSANTTLHRTMAEGEIALLGSLSSIGALVSTPTAGFLLDRIGRKKCSIISNLMAVIGWALIASSNRVEVVLTAIFISGLSSTAFIVNSVYIGEICQESIRGTMSAAILVFYGIGMLISYVMGGVLEYWTMVYADLSMAVLGSIGLFFLRESPMYLMSKGLEEEALKSIAYFRNTDVGSKEVLTELGNIKRALNPDLDDDGTSPEEEKLKPEGEKKEKKKLTTLQFIKKSRSTRRALLVALVLMTAAIFQGLPVVQVYADPLFSEAVPSLSSTMCSIILALIMVLVGFVGAYLTDAAGRKPLMIHGSIASGLSSVLLGSQIQFGWGPNWLTAVFIYAFTVFYTLGAGTVPYVLIAEVFLPEVKSFANMLVVEWAWLCNFLILFIFNPLVGWIGLGPVFYLFGLVCFLTAVFALVYLPETKGLPFEAIQMRFTPKKRRQNI